MPFTLVDLERVGRFFFTVIIWNVLSKYLSLAGHFLEIILNLFEKLQQIVNAVNYSAGKAGRLSFDAILFFDVVTAEILKVFDLVSCGLNFRHLR